MPQQSANVVGKAGPLPAARPRGTVQAMTVSGAAAAATMKTMDPTPSDPVRGRTRILIRSVAAGHRDASRG
jgi:hypothetical protein